MKRIRREGVLRVLLWATGLFCLVMGPYLIRCVGMRDLYVEAGWEPDEYDSKHEFWLRPALSGEPHWHLVYRHEGSGFLCVHAWRDQNLYWQGKPSGDQAFPAFPAEKEHLTICRYELDKEVYGEWGWGEM